MLYILNNLQKCNHVQKLCSFYAFSHFLLHFVFLNFSGYFSWDDHRSWINLVVCIGLFLLGFRTRYKYITLAGLHVILLSLPAHHQTQPSSTTYKQKGWKTIEGFLLLKNTTSEILLWNQKKNQLSLYLSPSLFQWCKQLTSMKKNQLQSVPSSLFGEGKVQ